VPQVSLNATYTSTYYTTFDVASFNAYSQAPRVYKKVTYAPSVGPDGLFGTYVQGTIATAPVWTAIITLANGVPTGVRWDEGCFFCAANTPSCAYSSFDTTNCSSGNPSVCSENPDSAHMSCYSDMNTCYPLLNGAPLVVNANSTTSELSALASQSASTSPTPSFSPSPGSPKVPVVVPDTSCDLKVFVVWDGTDSKGNVLKSVNKRFSVYRAFSVATAFQSALNAAQAGLDIANSVQNIAQGLPGQLTPGANERRGRQAAAAAAARGVEEQEEDALTEQRTALGALSIDPPLPGIVIPGV